MFKNHLNAAWRNICKNKVFSAINIIGLAIGMTACLLILQYVNFELSYDRFNRNVSDLYRVYNDRFQNGKRIQHGTITYSAIGQAMQNDYPEVVNHARVETYGKAIISYDNKRFGDQQVLAVDNAFLAMFSYDLVAGDQRTALTRPRTVVLTESAAGRYFGVGRNAMASVLGKAIVIGTDSLPYKVTGVCIDAPENSHLQFEMLVSYTSLFTGKYPYKEADYSFTESNFWHYIQLRPGTDYRRLEAKFPAFSNKYFQGNKVSGSVEKFYLQPLAQAHLYSDFEYEIGKTGSATAVWGLLIVALFIIVIAWVNYINLSTARSVERAREVGVRKVIGAARVQLIRQFLTESFLINLIALALAVLLMLLLQPAFNDLVGHQLSYSDLFQRSLGGYSLMVGLLLLVLSGIFMSASYPAFVLSAFRPVLVLKGRFSMSRNGVLLRKVLVVAQFAITVTLIIGSIVVYRQIRFMNSQELGMNIDRILVVKSPELTSVDSTFIGREITFSGELTRIPGVLGATTSWNSMGVDLARAFDVRRADQDNSIRNTLRLDGVSMGFLDLFHIQLLAGRDYIYTDFNVDFSKEHNLILNESAVHLLGFSSPRDAAGKSIIYEGKPWNVIGVIKDYHQKSLHYALEPELILPAYSNYNRVSIKLNARDIPATLAAIKKTYDAFFPGNYFNYFFLDERYNQQYANDQLFGKAFALFSAFAIFIACLGLLGLSLFSTIQRTKEIGIRKVLGASAGSIVLLLFGDFIRLVVVAIVIAIPVAWAIMYRWLQDFAYRTDIAWWVFAVAGLLAMGIALATIGYQALRSALANPVKSLRSE